MKAKGREWKVKVAEACSLEFLLLCSTLLPVLFTCGGYFFGKTVSPLAFLDTTVMLFVVALCAGARRAFAFLALIGLCLFLTCWTFSYVGADAQTYHFPMQWLLRNGWNPIFDSTIEKVSALAGEASFGVYHTLFLPKFSALCGALVASAIGVFSGDGFLGYVLIVCLLSTAFAFARRYWKTSIPWAALFAASLTFSTKMTSLLIGQVDFSTYASFCVVFLSLALYGCESRLRDLLVFSAASCICIATKTTGMLASFVLFALTLPWLFRRRAYVRALVIIAVVVLVLCFSPLLTAWIQYGSPFYPAHTFNPSVNIVDITSDFTGNVDALSMGYLSRICYAWVSPEGTVAVLRLLRGNPAFRPEFTVVGGVAGLGVWFNVLLLVSVVLLALSRKNIVTCLCVFLFLSSNFAPLKYIGYNRYFPQIWAIFPLAVLNFVHCPLALFDRPRMRSCRFACAGVCAFILASLTVFSLLRTLAFQGRLLVLEHYRQSIIAALPTDRSVKVSPDDCRFTQVMRFRQAGRCLVRSTDGAVDFTFDKHSGLPRFDIFTGMSDNLDRRFPIVNGLSALLFDFKWLDVPRNLPHVLWSEIRRSNRE